MKTKTAYSYIRFSTPEQQLGDSERRQLDGNKALCQQKGWQLSKMGFADRGISGFKGRNRGKGAMRDLLGIVKAGDVILIENVDRWGRDNPLDSVPALRQAAQTGIEFYFKNEGIHVTAESLERPEVRLLLFMAAERGNGESVRKRDMGRASWARRRAAIAQGLPARFRLPCWLARDASGKVIVNEAKAATVRRIFALAGEGHGILAIARLLNAERVAPITGSKKACWNLTSLRRLLRGKEVTGCYVPQTGEPVKGYYPAVVPDNLYYAALARLGDAKHIRARVSSTANLFCGLAFCRKCGAAMTAAGRAPHTLLICQGARNGRSKCRFSGVPLRLLEKCVFELLSDDLMGQLFKTETPDKLAELQGKLAGITAQITRAAETVGLLDGPPPQQLADKINGLQAEQKAITAEIEAERAATAAPVFEAWQELVRGQEYRDKLADPAARGELRRALHGILERVDCDPERKGNHWQAKLVLKGGPWCELELRRGGQWRLLATSDALKEAA